MWEGFLSSEEAYALYYDLLYSHRDVARETDFLERVFFSVLSGERQKGAGRGRAEPVFTPLELAKTWLRGPRSGSLA